MSRNWLSIQQLYADEHLASSIARRLFIAGFDIKERRRFLAPKQRGLTLQPIAACFYSRWCEFEIDRAAVFARHTLLGFYQHAMHIESRRDIFEKQDLNNIKLPLLTQTRFGQSWRFCPDCVIEDEIQNGTAFWHVQHQLPTARTCHKHQETVLVESCSSCGYKFVDLIENVTPGLKCPACHHELRGDGTFTHTENTLWLQEKGAALQSSEFDWMRPAHEFDLRYGLAQSFSHFTKKHRYRHDAVLQPAFLQWLEENNLLDYLVPEKRAVAHRFFSEKVVREHPLSAHVLSKLLWDRFLLTQ